jgi:hypothetical protein
VPYTFDDICKPNFEYFEYHRADQLEFDFMLLRGGTFEVLNAAKNSIVNALKNDDSIVNDGSPLERARFQTSCYYLNWLKSFEVGRYRQNFRIITLHLQYADFKIKNHLLPAHCVEMERYLDGLYGFYGPDSSKMVDSFPLN